MASYLPTSLGFTSPRLLFGGLLLVVWWVLAPTTAAGDSNALRVKLRTGTLTRANARCEHKPLAGCGRPISPRLLTLACRRIQDRYIGSQSVGRGRPFPGHPSAPVPVLGRLCGQAPVRHGLPRSRGAGRTGAAAGPTGGLRRQLYPGPRMGGGRRRRRSTDGVSAAGHCGGE